METILIKQKHLKRIIFFLSVIMIAGLILGVFLVRKFAAKEKHDGMSAIFLTNEQVYFGKIVKEDKEVIILEQVYYLKANAAIPNQQLDVEAQPTAQLSLIKLGDELHSPEDRMTINKQHVLFYESMKESGTIMDAITKHEQAKN